MGRQDLAGSPPYSSHALTLPSPPLFALPPPRLSLQRGRHHLVLPHRGLLRPAPSSFLPALRRGLPYLLLRT